jgi:hypothetical protein
LVRYENDILSAYVVKKFNDLILPSGDRILVEYLNEEFLRNFFLLNSSLNKNTLTSSANQNCISPTSASASMINPINASSSIINNNMINFMNNGKLNSNQHTQQTYGIHQKEMDFIINTTNNSNNNINFTTNSNNNNFKVDQNQNSSVLILNSKFNNQVYIFQIINRN